MLPEMFSHDVRVAPDELLKLIKCQCHALNNRCGGSRCSCKEANLQCTSFCGCHDDGIICVRYKGIADESPDAYEDIFHSDNNIDNENNELNDSESDDDFDNDLDYIEDHVDSV